MENKNKYVNENSRKDEGIIYEIYKIIFEADTFWGKTFDITLMIFILASLISVLLESVYSLGNKISYFF